MYKKYKKLIWFNSKKKTQLKMSNELKHFSKDEIQMINDYIKRCSSLTNREHI